VRRTRSLSRLALARRYRHWKAARVLHKDSLTSPRARRRRVLPLRSVVPGLAQSAPLYVDGHLWVKPLANAKQGGVELRRGVREEEAASLSSVALLPACAVRSVQAPAGRVARGGRNIAHPARYRSHTVATV